MRTVSVAAALALSFAACSGSRHVDPNPAPSLASNATIDMAGQWVVTARALVNTNTSAVDHLAALLAAAERAEVEWAFTLGELVKHTDPLEHKMRCEDHDVFRAAIRRAKGEQP